MGSPASDRRRSQRIKIYIGERIDVSFYCDEKRFKGEAISLSPYGLGVAIPATKLCRTIKPGAHIEMLIQPSGRSESKVEADVRNCELFERDDGFYFRVGVEFRQTRAIPSIVPRDSTRHTTNVNFRPTLFFEHPWFQGQLVYMQVVDIGLKGVRCQTSARNNGIFKGLRMRAQMCFPVIGTTQLNCEVAYVNQSDDNTLVLGIEFLSNVEEVSGLTAEYLMLTGSDANIRDLREEGYAVKGYGSGITFGSMRSREQFAEILQLRLLGQHSIGAFAGESDYQLMKDEFDKSSRHILAYHNGDIIASARILFNNGCRDRCEHESYGFTVPEWLWEAGFVESSRLVVHPDFRGRDMFGNLIGYIGQTILQAGYRYMVASCDDRLLRSYLASGCTKIGEFVNEDGENWNLFVLDIIRSSACGKGVNPLAWDAVLKSPSEFLESRGYIQRSKLSHWKAKAFEWLSPLANYILTKATRSKSDDPPKAPRSPGNSQQQLDDTKIVRIAGKR